MKAYLYPGQGAQFEGMGKDLYHDSAEAKAYFDQANEILGFKITDVMFEGSAEDLKQTKVTQPAIFIHSVIKTMLMEDFSADCVAGHSLGEFSALVAAGGLSFEEGLKLVQIRANAMQKACEHQKSTMAAIVGLEDQQIEEICSYIDEMVVPANYNCPGQLVISGTIEGVELACEKLKEAGARRALILPVGGAFHSPLMEMAREELAKAINEITIKDLTCPIYQNVTASKETDASIIKENLIAQLTSPVRWTPTMKNMVADGCDSFLEIGGRGGIMTGLLRKFDRSLNAESV